MSLKNTNVFFVSNGTISAEWNGSGVHTVVLIPVDIPGARLGELFEAHAIPALKWCAWKKKAKLIDRFILTKVSRLLLNYHIFLFSRIHKAGTRKYIEHVVGLSSLDEQPG